MPVLPRDHHTRLKFPPADEVTSLLHHLKQYGLQPIFRLTGSDTVMVSPPFEQTLSGIIRKGSEQTINVDARLSAAAGFHYA